MKKFVLIMLATFFTFTQAQDIFIFGRPTPQTPETKAELVGTDTFMIQNKDGDTVFMVMKDGQIVGIFDTEPVKKQNLDTL